MSEQIIRVRATVRGQVQAVGFRAFVLHHAHRLGLRGTVANRPDGCVECLVEGPSSRVEALVEQLWIGPYHARVDSVDVHPVAAAGALPPMTVTV